MNWTKNVFGWLQSPPDAAPFQMPLEKARTARWTEDFSAAQIAISEALPTANNIDKWRLLAEQAALYLAMNDLQRAATTIELIPLPPSRAQLKVNVPASPMGVGQAQALLEAQLLRGRIQTAQGHLDRAIELFEQVRQAAEGIPVLNEIRAAAMVWLADLTESGGNASYASYLLREALPHIPAHNAEVASFAYGRLGDALLVIGQGAEGYHEIGRSLLISEQAGLRAYTRRWSLALANRAMGEARYYDAETHFTRVINRSTPEHLVRETVIAYIGRGTAARLAQDNEMAIESSREALRYAEVLGDTGLVQQAQAALGAALNAAGQGEAAIPLLEAVRAEDAPVETLRVLASAYLNVDRADDALAVAEQVLARLESNSAAPLERANAQRDLGIVHQRRGDETAAISAWSVALPLYENAHAYAQLARLYCDLATARRAQGQTARALKEMDQALMTLNSVDEYDIDTRGRILANAALMYAEQGEVESADAFFTESVDIAARLNDSVAESLRAGNYGWFLLTVGRPRRAITLLERALMASTTPTLQRAVQLDNLGLAHDAIGDLPIALEQHEQALTLLATLNEPVWEATVRLNTANTLIALARYDEAASLLENALVVARVSNLYDLLARALTARALLALRQGNRTEAVTAELEEAVTLGRAHSRRALAEALTVLSQWRAAEGNLPAANLAWEEAAKTYAALHMPQAKLAPAWLQNSTED